MIFNVPQYIEVDDKIAFQLTAKQLGWFLAGGVVMYIVWNMTESTIIFIMTAVIVGAISMAFAFLHPAGTSLIVFLTGGFRYMTKPKVVIWKRRPRKEYKQKKKVDKSARKGNLFLKKQELKNISDLADILDKESDI